MEYANKLVYLSNQWYNDGLKKANIRDLSGAVKSLKKSLQYNRGNIASRNLLGLVYYGRGEVAEALVEWIISKNMKARGNIANYYIKKVQEATSELEAVDQAVKKYNQCLTYCRQNGEDLAAIQLKKVIAAHPTFLKAYQLLALLYIEMEQYAKAKQLLRKAHQLDVTNELTISYMHELKHVHSQKTAKLKPDKEHTISYNLGNETIIQPVSATLKDNATLLTILNISIGLVVGVAVIWFLAVPSVKQKMNAKNNKEILAYSEQIAALESELDLQEKKIAIYQQASDTTEAEKLIAQGTQASYEALVTVIEHYHKENYDREKLVDEILAVKIESLGNLGKSTYETIRKEIFKEQCKELYPIAERSYEAVNYKRAVQCLERIMLMDETYEDGEALFMLMDIYHKQKKTEDATIKYNRILELYPDTKLAERATKIMGTQGQEQ